MAGIRSVLQKIHPFSLWRAAGRELPLRTALAPAGLSPGGTQVIAAHINQVRNIQRRRPGLKEA